MIENGYFYISGQFEGVIRKSKEFIVINMFDKDFGNLSCTIYKEKLYSLYHSKFEYQKMYYFKAKVSGEQFVFNNSEIKIFNNITVIKQLKDDVLSSSLDN